MEKNIIKEKVLNYDIQRTMGLPYELICKVGAKYIMTLNVNIADALVNGAIGTLRHTDVINKNNKTIPVILWMEFQFSKTG